MKYEGDYCYTFIEREGKQLYVFDDQEHDEFPERGLLVLQQQVIDAKDRALDFFLEHLHPGFFFLVFRVFSKQLAFSHF
jgi:hypothetical protein